MRKLLREYAAELNVDLCFQGFDEELAGLPGDYAAPSGALLIARAEGRGGACPAGWFGLYAGCVALRRQEGEIAEMKRLFVRQGFRALGLGRAFAEAILDEARALGYRRIRLDTLPQMTAARALYERLGFVEIAPYYANPVAGTRYLEKTL